MMKSFVPGGRLKYCGLVDRNEVLDAPGHLLAITPDSAGPEDILFLGPSDWYGILRALAVLMPCLGDEASCNV